MKNIAKDTKKIITTIIVAVCISLIPVKVYANDISKQAADTAKTQTDTQANVKMSPKYTKGTYHVAQDGSGDFTSLATAVVLVPSGSTLIIHEGIYNEALNILGKVVNMKGVSKERCVIQFDTANYSRVPLNISGGVYENLTINGYHKAEQQGPFPGYAIHIDHDSLAGQAVVFSNCNIISENTFCVGIGLRRGARVAFRGCSFNAKKQGVMLFHDSQTPALAGTASLSIENCIINNSATGLIYSQSISPASTTNLTFRNNTVIGNGDGHCIAYGSGVGNGWLGAQNVVLTKNSAGNNVKSFNYADAYVMGEALKQQAVANAAQNVQVTSQPATQPAPQVAPQQTTTVTYPIRKFYTIINEYGQEVNVPLEMIDGIDTSIR